MADSRLWPRTLIGLVAVFQMPVASAKELPGYACAFLDPVFFGASISAGYGGIGDGIAATVSTTGSNYHGKNLNPVEELEHSYFGAGEPTNLSGNGQAGAPQLRSYLGTLQGRKSVENSSMLASLDAFYWPAIRGQCKQAAEDAKNLATYAEQLKKPLILATVPLDDSRFVDPIIQIAGWSPPRKKCVDQINKSLKENCKLANQCYLIDLNKTVAGLNKKGIFFEGKLSHTYDFRFDGIHLAPAGKRYLMKLITDKLAENPPACSEDPAQTEMAASRAVGPYAKSPGSENAASQAVN